MSHDIAQLPVLKKVVIVENHQSKLVFHPVENSLKKKNKSNNELLKRAILKAAKEYLSPQYSAEIPVVWMYFMDYLTEGKNNYVWFDDVQTKATELGFVAENMRAMIKFYHQTGTIVNFAQTVKTRSKIFEELILLNPHWLLKALACFLDEVNTHGTKRHDYPRLADTITEYEATAILP